MYYVGIYLCLLKLTMSQTFVSAREQIVKNIKKVKMLKTKNEQKLLKEPVQNNHDKNIGILFLKISNLIATMS